MSAVVAAPALPESPFKGLIPYTEDDAAFFFGRDEEIEVVIANLEARRLTLLYGESGVGKSSLLRAGVLHRLRETSRRNLEEIGTPEIVPVYFAAWRDDPVAALLDAVGEAVSTATGRPAEEVPPSGRLDEALEHWAGQADADILIVLDQFEEYFLYHPPGQAEGTFAAELPRALNNPRLRARFVLAIREDALAKLDRFKRAIPALFNTYLRVRHLNRESAREAITRPVQEYNRISDDGRGVQLERELVEAVLDQVTAGRVVLEQAGLGAGIDDSARAEERIEAPYLQLVMSRLWAEERRSGSGMLRESTLEQLGGAKHIVETHLDEAMDVLSETDRNVAAGLFRHLVTPSGTKIAFTSADLASYVSLSESEVQPVLERLSAGDVRILRTVEPPPGEKGEIRYEIFHDVLAGVVLDWRTRYLKDRELGDTVRLGYAGVVHGFIAFGILFLSIGFIGLGFSETPWYFVGLIWSLVALAVWGGATRALFRRWNRSRAGLWLAVPLAELTVLTVPISLAVLGVRRLELRHSASRALADGPPLGRPRGIRTGMLLFVATLGLYGWYWAFRTQHETAQHTGAGLGGAVGAAFWILLPPLDAFIIPSEVGAMYRRRRLKPPVSGWTGLWFFPFGLLIVPAFVWFAKVQGALNRYWTESAQPS